ncbi:SGNH/GDSL hydrolase family protein [Nocardioides montaniterrae]
MTRWGAVLALLTGLLATLLTACDATTDDAGHPVRVMVVGDSISQGRPGDATWRYWFCQAFAHQHVPLKMVGPTIGQRNGAMDYELPWDNEAHAAKGGSRIEYHLTRIVQEMRTYRPDVVAIEIGFNNAREENGPQVAAGTMQLIDRIWSVDPDTKIVYGEIPLRDWYPSGTPVKDRNRHAEVASRIVAEKLAGDDRVAIAHVVTAPDRPWDPRLYSTDGTHPTATGQTLVAQRYAEAFHDLGILPEQPQIFHERTWNPQPQAAVSRASTGGLHVDWHAVVADDWTTSVRITVTDASGSTVADHTYPTDPQRWTDPTSATYVVPPGTYRVVLTPIRGWMTGAPGPAVTIVLKG